MKGEIVPGATGLGQGNDRVQSLPGRTPEKEDIYFYVV